MLFVFEARFRFGLVGSRCSKAKSYDEAITAHLMKRSDLFGEASTLQDRTAEIKNHMSAPDRVLGYLDYENDLDAATPRLTREVPFAVANSPGASSTHSERVHSAHDEPRVLADCLSLTNHDARDRKLMTEHTRRVSKALWALKTDRVGRG